MARIRSIKPEFWTHPDVVECSTNARLLFIGLWNFCDDSGRHVASPKQAKAEVFPSDNFSLSAIQKMMDELAVVGLITYYSVDGKQYFFIPGWHHQKIDRPQPSKFPEPAAINRRTFDERSSLIGRDKIGKDGKGKISAAPSALTLVSSHDNPVVISFPTNKPGEHYEVLQSHFDQFQSLYPAVDIAQELRSMAGWLFTHPRNVKTKAGTPKFINTWLSKAQDRSKANGHGKPTRNDNWLAGAAALAAELRGDGK